MRLTIRWSHKIRSGHFLHPRFFSVKWSTLCIDLWNLNFHLWTTAENLIRMKEVAGGKIKCKIKKQKEAYIRERLECCVRVCTSTPGSGSLAMIVKYKCSSSAIPASNRCFRARDMCFWPAVRFRYFDPCRTRCYINRCKLYMRSLATPEIRCVIATDSG